jgi:Holliday junction resolvase
MKEKQLQYKILKLLRLEKAYSIKQIVSNKAGVPDIVFCINGLFGAIEVKGDKGKPSELQLYNINKIKKAGGKAIICNNIKQAKELIWEMKNKNK